MTGIMKTLLPLVLAAVATLAAPITHTPRQDTGKLVVAHHIVGNTASYTADTWKSDIQLAQANGVDGFALNIASAAPFTDAQVANA
jgi:glucan endo-1,3-alpha-glucosidase